MSNIFAFAKGDVVRALRTTQGLVCDDKYIVEDLESQPTAMGYFVQYKVKKQSNGELLGSWIYNANLILEKVVEPSPKFIPVKTTNLFHRFQNWTMEEYGTLCAMTEIDIVRPEGIRWTYGLIFEVYPTPKGVDGEGSRASGCARASVIDGKPKAEHTLVDIGSVIKTPFGLYRVEWYSRTDHDNIKLIELKEL